MKYTNVKLNIYNYSEVTEIAKFTNGLHDAIKCMKALNDDQIKAHNHLPESIFYFVSYKAGGRTKRFIDCSLVAPTNLTQQCQKLIDISNKETATQF
jgi:DNA repair ATPase RecN